MLILCPIRAICISVEFSCLNSWTKVHHLEVLSSPKLVKFVSRRGGDKEVECSLRKDVLH